VKFGAFSNINIFKFNYGGKSPDIDRQGRFEKRVLRGIYGPKRDDEYVQHTIVRSLAIYPVH